MKILFLRVKESEYVISVKMFRFFVFYINKVIYFVEVRACDCVSNNSVHRLLQFKNFI